MKLQNVKLLNSQLKILQYVSETELGEMDLEPIPH